MATTQPGPRFEELLASIARSKPLPAPTARYTPPMVRQQLQLRDYGLQAIRRAPSLEQSIRQIAAGAPSPAPGGLGNIGRLAGGVLRPIASAASTLGVGQRAVVSTLQELRDALDDNVKTNASFTDWENQVADPTYGFGTFVPMQGWGGRLVGFAGDVLTDPLTYMTFGANTVFGNIPRRLMSEVVNEAGERLSTRALIGSKTVVGRDGRAALAKTAAMLGANDNVVADIAARGRIALPEDLAARIGLPKLGVYFFGGRVRVPMSESLGRAALSGLTIGRLSIVRSAPGRKLQELFTPGGVSGNINLRDVRARLARGESLDGGVSARQGIALLAFNDGVRSTENIIGREVGEQMNREFMNDPEVLANRKTMYQVAEGLRPAVGGEQRAVEKFRAITDGWLQRLNAYGASLDPRYKPIEPRENWFPWMMSEQAQKFVDDSQSIRAIEIRKYLTIDPTDTQGSFNARLIADRVRRGEQVVWWGRELTVDDLNIERLNEIARAGGFQGNFFETDALMALAKYSNNFAAQMGVYGGFDALARGGFDPDAVAGYAAVRGVYSPEALEALRESVRNRMAAITSNTGGMVAAAKQIDEALQTNLGGLWRATVSRSGLSAAEARTVLDKGLDAVALGAPARARVEEAYRVGLFEATGKLATAQGNLRDLRTKLDTMYRSLRADIDGDTLQLAEWEGRHAQLTQLADSVDAKIEELRIKASEQGYAYGSAERKAEIDRLMAELREQQKVLTAKANEAKRIYDNQAQFAETAYELIEDVSAYARGTLAGQNISDAIDSGTLFGADVKKRAGATTKLPDKGPSGTRKLSSITAGGAAGDENMAAWVRLRDDVFGGLPVGQTKLRSTIANRSDAVTAFTLGASEAETLERVTGGVWWLLFRNQMNDPTWAKRQLANMDENVQVMLNSYKKMREAQDLLFGKSADSETVRALAELDDSIRTLQDNLERAQEFSTTIDLLAVKGSNLQRSFLRDVFNVENWDDLDLTASMTTDQFEYARRWVLSTTESVSDPSVRQRLDTINDFFESKLAQSTEQFGVTAEELTTGFGIRSGAGGTGGYGALDENDLSIQQWREIINTSFPLELDAGPSLLARNMKMPEIFTPAKGEDMMSTLTRQTAEWEKQLSDATTKRERVFNGASKRVMSQYGEIQDNALGNSSAALSAAALDVLVDTEIKFVLDTATTALLHVGQVLSPTGSALLAKQTALEMLGSVDNEVATVNGALAAWQRIRDIYGELSGSTATTGSTFDVYLLGAINQLRREDPKAYESVLQMTGPVILAANERLGRAKNVPEIADVAYMKWVESAVDFYVRHMPARRNVPRVALETGISRSGPESGRMVAAALQRSEQGYRYLGSELLQRQTLTQDMLMARSHKERIGLLKKWVKEIKTGTTGKMVQVTDESGARMVDAAQFDVNVQKLIQSGDQAKVGADAAFGSRQASNDGKRIAGKSAGTKEARARARRQVVSAFALSRAANNAFRRNTSRNNVLYLFQEILGGPENDISLLVGDIKTRGLTGGVRTKSAEKAYLGKAKDRMEGVRQKLLSKYVRFATDDATNAEIAQRVEHMQYLDETITRLRGLIADSPKAKQQLARLEKIEAQALRAVGEEKVDVQLRIQEAERLGLTPPPPGRRLSPVRRQIGDIRPVGGKLNAEQSAAVKETKSAIDNLLANESSLSEMAFTPQQRAALVEYFAAKRELAELMTTEQYGLAHLAHDQNMFRFALAGNELGGERMMVMPTTSAGGFRVWNEAQDTKAMRAAVRVIVNNTSGMPMSSLPPEASFSLTNVTEFVTTEPVFEAIVQQGTVGAHRIVDPFGKGFVDVLSREADTSRPELIFLDASGYVFASAKDARKYHLRTKNPVTIIDPDSHVPTRTTMLGDEVKLPGGRVMTTLKNGDRYDPNSTWVRVKMLFEINPKAGVETTTATPQLKTVHRYIRMSQLPTFESNQFNVPLPAQFTEDEFESLFIDLKSPLYKRVRNPQTYRSELDALRTRRKELIASRKNAQAAVVDAAQKARNEQAAAARQGVAYEPRKISLPTTVKRRRKIDGKFKIVEEAGTETRTYQESAQMWLEGDVAKLTAIEQEISELEQAARVVAARTEAEQKLSILYSQFDDEQFQYRLGIANKGGKASPATALQRYLQKNPFEVATSGVAAARRNSVRGVWNASEEGAMMARAAELRKKANNDALSFMGRDESLVRQLNQALSDRAQYARESADAINNSNLRVEIFNKLKSLGVEPKGVSPVELRAALRRAERAEVVRTRKDFPVSRVRGGVQPLETPEMLAMAKARDDAANELKAIGDKIAELDKGKQFDKQYEDAVAGLLRERRELTGGGVAYTRQLDIAGQKVRGRRRVGKPRGGKEPSEAKSFVDVVGNINVLMDARTQRRVRGVDAMRREKAKLPKLEGAVTRAQAAFDAAESAATAEDALAAQKQLNVLRDAFAAIKGAPKGKEPRAYRPGMSDAYIEYGTKLDDAADMLERVLDPAVSPEIRGQIVRYAQLVSENTRMSLELGQAESMVQIAEGVRWVGGELPPPKVRFYTDMLEGAKSPEEIISMGDVTELARVLGDSNISWVPHFDKGMVRLSRNFPSIQVREELANIIQNSRRLQEPEVLREFNRFIGRYTQFFKTYATLSPGFHLRNAISNGFMLFAAGGDVRAMAEGLDLSRRLAEWLKTGKGTTEQWIATLPREQQAAADIAVRAAAASGMGSSSDVMRNFLVQGKALNNKATRTSRSVMMWIETHSRFMLAYDSAVKGMDMATASARVRRFLLDYEDVSTADKALRQIIPFWMWTSRNLPLQLQNMWLNPKAYAMYAHLKRNFSEEDDQTPVPEWMREMGAWKLPFGENLYAQPDLPFTRIGQDIEMLQDPQRLLANVNPLLRLPVELGGDRQLYSGRAFSETPVPVGGTLQAEVLQPLLQIAGYGQTGPQGQKFVNDKAYYALRNLFPLLGTTERLSPSIPTYQERGVRNPLLGFLGAPVREVTPDMQTSELKRRNAMIQDALRQYMAVNQPPE